MSLVRSLPLKLLPNRDLRSNINTAASTTLSPLSHSAIANLQTLVLKRQLYPSPRFSNQIKSNQIAQTDHTKCLVKLLFRAPTPSTSPLVSQVISPAPQSAQRFSLSFLRATTNTLPERAVAERSMLIKNLLEDLGESEEPVPIPNVNESVLKKVIEWCTHHKNDPQSTGEDDDNRRRTTEIDEWDQKFMQVDQEMLFEIILVRQPLLEDLPAILVKKERTLIVIGRQLPRHQGPPRCWLQDRRKHDQGQVP